MSDSKKIFQTNDTALVYLNGQAIEIIRPLTDKEADLDETGPMFRVRFPDAGNFLYDVFANEIKTNN